MVVDEADELGREHHAPLPNHITMVNGPTGVSPLPVVTAAAIAHYRAHGWVVIEDAVPLAECARIASVLDAMLRGDIDTRRNRADLGGHAPRVEPLTENIVQIAWPTDLTSALDENGAIQAARALCDALYGQEPGTFALDMNQFLVKAPHTDTDTPWVSG